jgi:diguanylate cyclase (GGDEF)-like protein
MATGGRTWWVRCLSAAPWLAAVAIAVGPWLTDGVAWVRPAMIGAFLVVVVARMWWAAGVAIPARRTPIVVMGCGLALFASGALVLALDPGLPFPSPVEAVFGSAYMCFVWFLILDANGGRARDLRTVLETSVVAGGIISAAVFALLVPSANRLGLNGGPLLVAMAYPIADVVLISTVITQLLTGRRVFHKRTALLLAGLVTLAAVDTSLPLQIGSGGYAFSSLQDLLWALSLATLAAAAVRTAAYTVGRTGIGSVVPVGAGLLALLLLVSGARSGSRWVTQVPASLTILLLLGLLLTSLREARRGIEAQRLSLTDDLTGIGNRRAVMEILTNSPGQPLSLVLIDLNGFKVVNDTLGHQQGDRLLEGFAERLQSVVHDAAVVARLGGDEFAVVYRGIGAEDMTQRVEALLVVMCRPLQVAGLNLTVGLSVGISTDEHGHALGIELLRRADVAMYCAKDGGGGYQWYDAATDNFSTENLHLVEDLRTGIAADQLCAHYQPQVRALDGALVAVEALVRWQHPDRGVLAPQHFLPVARQAGLMLALSLKMIEVTIAQTAEWAEKGSPLRLSLNVDPPELLSGQWVPALLAAVARHALDPALVTVELTEEVLLSDFTRATKNIEELARHHIGVSIDDFGTGYSGLSWLQTLPVTELKLDRGFVSRVLSDSRTRHIVESTIDLGDRLGIRVVAEGVENTAIATALTDMGAHLLQGYVISRPLRPEALDAWRSTHAYASPTAGF